MIRELGSCGFTGAEKLGLMVSVVASMREGAKGGGGGSGKRIGGGRLRGRVAEAGEGLGTGGTTGMTGSTGSRGGRNGSGAGETGAMVDGCGC